MMPHTEMRKGEGGGGGVASALTMLSPRYQ